MRKFRVYPLVSLALFMILFVGQGCPVATPTPPVQPPPSPAVIEEPPAPDQLLEAPISVAPPPINSNSSQEELLN
ncbi:MAG: hypothetical protein HYT48_01525 [Candidatus Vogelbacteria bacterium]|nr:hypothetical protein [Candidatus Vogelbacteria bacterium]